LLSASSRTDTCYQHLKELTLVISCTNALQQNLTLIEFYNKKHRDYSQVNVS